MPDFPLGFVGEFHTAAAAARDRGWLVVQHADHAWHLRAETPADTAAVVRFLNSHDPLAMERREAASRLRAEADRRVAALLPLADQVILITRAVELIDKRMSGGAWDEDDQADAELSRQACRAARRVRSAQARIAEIEIAPLLTSHELERFDPAASPLWDQAPPLEPVTAFAAAATEPATATGEAAL